MPQSARKLSTAEDRWAGIGPYYAMFPVAFADEIVQELTNEGECVLDPFSGRGTAVFSAATRGRVGLGVEINPVGWVYAKAKLQPAPEKDVISRLKEINALASSYSREAKLLSNFFHGCFCRSVRRFLCAARADLDWRRTAVDWTLMAFILIYLHCSNCKKTQISP